MELERAKDKLRPLVERSECQAIQNCSAHPIGKKGCGGPNGYIVAGTLPSVQDQVLWDSTLRRISEIDQSIMDSGDFVHLCDYYVPPKLLACLENKCVSLSPENEWRNYLE